MIDTKGSVIPELLASLRLLQALDVYEPLLLSIISTVNIPTHKMHSLSYGKILAYLPRLLSILTSV